MKNLRIRYHLAGGQWTYWLNEDQLKNYHEEQIKAVVIEETVSYKEYLKFMKGRGK